MIPRSGSNVWLNVIVLNEIRKLPQKHSNLEIANIIITMETLLIFSKLLSVLTIYMNKPQVYLLCSINCIIHLSRFYFSFI